MDNLDSVDVVKQSPMCSKNLVTECSTPTELIDSPKNEDANSNLSLNKSFFSNKNDTQNEILCCGALPHVCQTSQNTEFNTPPQTLSNSLSQPVKQRKSLPTPAFKWPHWPGWRGVGSAGPITLPYKWPRQNRPASPPEVKRWPRPSVPDISSFHHVARDDLKKETLIKKVNMPIGGINLEFPHEPYPVQKYMIFQVISAVKKAKNCLLESPTGTGKTLGLLCSTLAWQQQEEELLRELNASSSEIGSYNSVAVSKNSSDTTTPSTTPSSDFREPLSSGKKSVLNEKETINLDSDDDDEDIFQVPKRKKRSAILEEPQMKQCDSANKTSDATKSDVETGQKLKDLEILSGNELFRAPKIFYGTRTHKQISQVVDQLKKTSYGSKVKMTILAARDHTCVNNHVLNQPNITETCQALLDPVMGMGCSYYTGTSRGMSHAILNNCQLPTVYDIEDIVKVGKKHKLCPYFTLRNLVSQSDIIFCPYNYLIDPIIRESMNINLAKSIVIMDEAHNIEDTCREAGSMWLRQSELADAIIECDENVKRSNNSVEYGKIKDFLVMLDRWLSENGQIEQYSAANESVRSTNGQDLISWLEIGGITQEIFQQLKENVAQINQKKVEFPDENESISGKVKQITSALITVLGYIFKPENTKMYQSYFFRDMTLKKPVSSASWLSNQSRKTTEPRWQYSLHVTCLSPAIVFSELLSARSIILASGTLSPLESFQLELGVDFPHIVKGGHVIPLQNLFATALECGPQRYNLKGVFETANTYEYQDELGRAILETVKIVPHGVLCFFPSYSLMDKLKERWQSTGLIEELEQVKEPFWEPRQKNAMNNTMMGFTERIELSVENPSEEIGAIMFGVFRGKIAEGIDFSDNNARAVIAVGIPFMNMHSKEISLKIKFNDGNTNTSKKFLSGSQWYRIQAYRALNQALGRCIRHKNDWGAVILMDSRMCSSDNQSNLPRWIQQKMQTFRGWEVYLQSLSQFCERMKKTDEENAAASGST